MRTLSGQGLAAIVLGRALTNPLARLAFAAGAAIALHTGLGLSALHWRSARLSKIASNSARAPLRIDHVVDLSAPQATAEPDSSPVPKVERVAARAQRARTPAADASAPVAPSPARAAQVVAAEAGPAEPLDFTDFDMVTGSAERYAGGESSSLGGSNRPVRDGSVELRAPAGRVEQRSRARRVGLPARDWRCPWPSEADGISSKEQTVVIRVVVRADGSVASAQVLSDPGNGFGAVALACAREQTFPPATDDEGRAITAISPPVRIRFMRE